MQIWWQYKHGISAWREVIVFSCFLNILVEYSLSGQFVLYHFLLNLTALTLTGSLQRSSKANATDCKNTWTALHLCPCSFKERNALNFCTVLKIVFPQVYKTFFLFNFKSIRNLGLAFFFASPSIALYISLEVYFKNIYIYILYFTVFFSVFNRFSKFRYFFFNIKHITNKMQTLFYYSLEQFPLHKQYINSVQYTSIASPRNYTSFPE